MTTEVKRKRGAPPGNRNASQADYYHALNPEERQMFRKISRSHGFELEITGLRRTIKSILSKDPVDYHLLKQAYSALKFLVRQQLRLDRDDSRRLGKTAESILKDMSVLTGILFPSRSSKGPAGRVSPERVESASLQPNESVINSPLPR